MFYRIFPTSRTTSLLLVDGSLPAVVRLDDGCDGGAQHQYGSQAAVGHPVVSHPAEDQVDEARHRLALNKKH